MLTVAEHGTADYEIRFIGSLAPRWADWFDGMTLTAHDDGTSVICGPVTDQSALYGLIRKLSDLGLPLVSVARSHATDAKAPTHHTPRSTP